MRSSLVIDELALRSRKAGAKVGLAYVYCDYRDQAQQTAKNIVGGILKQLFAALPLLPPEMITMYEQKSKQERRSFELLDAADFYL